jgi:hypothetical protein
MPAFELESTHNEHRPSEDCLEGLDGLTPNAVGEQWDESKFKAYPAGTLYSEPPRTPHYEWW